jgi:hypothetical protein
MNHFIIIFQVFAVDLEIMRMKKLMRIKISIESKRRDSHSGQLETKGKE